MIFRKISYKIAWQFTGFVFLLFVVNGVFFLVADFNNAKRMSQGRLQRSSRIIERQAIALLHGEDVNLPPNLQGRIRVITNSGVVVQDNEIFSNSVISLLPGYSTMFTAEDEYNILTFPVFEGATQLGYIQIAEFEHAGLQELPVRFILYLIVSTIISLLTFWVGLFFARRSLKPAEAMMMRLEQFTQDASHELRTPITAVSTSLDLALISKDNAEYIKAAKQDLKHLGTLVDKLLELARLDSFVLRTETIHIKDVIDDVLMLFSTKILEKSISVKITVDTSTTVSTDPLLFKQLISNLIGNAIKFNKNKGSITITATDHDVMIQDTGQGITKEALPHIFNRFYQEDESRSATFGAGLGLALVKRIVDLHNWTIEILSEKKKGTTCIVIFGSRE